MAEHFRIVILRKQKIQFEPKAGGFNYIASLVHGCVFVCAAPKCLHASSTSLSLMMIIQFSKENVLKLDTNRDDNGFIVV